MHDTPDDDFLCVRVCACVFHAQLLNCVPAPPVFLFSTFLREFPALSLLSIFIASASLIIFGALYNVGKNGEKTERSAGLTGLICEVTAHLGNVNKSDLSWESHKLTSGKLM